MGIEQVVLGERVDFIRGTSWFARFKPLKKEPFVAWKVKMPDGTEKWSPDLLSQEELDFVFQRVYVMAVNFLEEKKPHLLLPAEIGEELMPAGKAVKNVETSLQKLWLVNVGAFKLVRLSRLLEFGMIGKKRVEKEREEREAIDIRVGECGKNRRKLRENLSWKEKEWEWFWVEDAKQFSKAIKSEYKKIIKLMEKLIEKDNRAVKKSRSELLLIDVIREAIAREMVQFLKEKSEGNKEVMEAKIKEMEAIGQNAIAFFDGDLTKIGKRVERRLEGPRTLQKKIWSVLKDGVYPFFVSATSGLIVWLLLKCNGPEAATELLK